MGFREGVAAFLRFRVWVVKRWVRSGGDANRTARHESLWLSMGVVFAGLGGTLRFAQTGATDHALGYVLLFASAWIALAFFFPLWLPRVRDSELIRQRREEDRLQREQAEAKLIETIFKTNVVRTEHYDEGSAR